MGPPEHLAHAGGSRCLPGQGLGTPEVSRHPAAPRKGRRLTNVCFLLWKGPAHLQEVAPGLWGLCASPGGGRVGARWSCLA